MKLARLALGLALVVVLIVGCLGGEDDSLAPRGPAHLRFYCLLYPDRGDSIRVVVDDSLLWSANSAGQISPTFQFLAGTHHILIESGDGFTYAQSDLNFLAQASQLMLVADPAPFLVSDGLHSTSDLAQLRLVNALAESLMVDLKTESGATFFSYVPQNHSTYYRTLYSSSESFYLSAYESYSADHFIAGLSIFPHPDSVYTLVLSGMGRYVPRMRLIVDPIQP